MRFLVDECFPKRLVTALASSGHDVVWASDVCPSDPDELILARATSEGRIIVAEDGDFGELSIRDGHPAVGIVIAVAARFPGKLPQAIEALTSEIDRLSTHLVGFLTMIEPGRVRQHKLPEVISSKTAARGARP